jgi:hypothetical protein
MDSLAGLLAGLVTVSVTGLITIKKLHVVFRVNKDNISIAGDHNRVDVIKIYNQQMADDGSDYRLLWPTLAVLLIVTFSFHPAAFCTSLYVLAWLCPAVALVAFFVNVVQLGLKRIWDIWYAPASLLLAWTTIQSFPCISKWAPNGAFLYVVWDIISLRSLNVPFLWENGYIQKLGESASIGMGFCLLYLAQIWLGFSFLRWRNFSDALARSGRFLAMGLFGAVFSWNLVVAMTIDSRYVTWSIHAVCDPIVRFLVTVMSG